MTLTGGATDNTIAGTMEVDILSGGGDDVFVFAPQQGGSGHDMIADFGDSADGVLVGSNTVDSGLGTATVPLHDGTTLIAGYRHLWTGGDFL